MRRLHAAAPGGAAAGRLGAVPVLAAAGLAALGPRSGPHGLAALVAAVAPSRGLAAVALVAAVPAIAAIPAIPALAALTCLAGVASLTSIVALASISAIVLVLACMGTGTVVLESPLVSTQVSAVGVALSASPMVSSAAPVVPLLRRGTLNLWPGWLAPVLEVETLLLADAVAAPLVGCTTPHQASARGALEGRDNGPLLLLLQQQQRGWRGLPQQGLHIGQAWQCPGTQECSTGCQHRKRRGGQALQQAGAKQRLLQQLCCKDLGVLCCKGR